MGKSGNAEVRDAGVLTGKKQKFCGTSPAFYQVRTKSWKHLKWVLCGSAGVYFKRHIRRSV